MRTVHTVFLTTETKHYCEDDLETQVNKKLEFLQNSCLEAEIVDVRFISDKQAYIVYKY